MKTFKDYTVDQQNDFYLFHSIKSDLDSVNYLFNTLLNTSYVKNDVDFHNNIVKARTILDIIINSINDYENEDTNPTEEDF